MHNKENLMLIWLEKCVCKRLCPNYMVFSMTQIISFLGIIKTVKVLAQIQSNQWLKHLWVYENLFEIWAFWASEG